MADVGIAGAGLAGPLLAVFLSRRGHDVTLYERRPDPRSAVAAGRSINLALSARGIDALQRVGLADEVMAHALAMPLGSWDLKIPHSIAIAVMLPVVMEFNCTAAPERFVAVARALGEPRPPSRPCHRQAQARSR